MSQSDLAKAALDKELTLLQQRYKQRFIVNRALIIGGISVVLASLILAVSWANPYFLYGLLLAGVMHFVPITFPVAQMEFRLRELETERELLDIAQDSLESRAEKLFKLNQFEVKKYYDQTLRHSRWIFVVGVVSILIGFVVVGAALYLMSRVPAGALSDKIVLAVLGGVGGLLSNFVAAIYLRMFSKTTDSLTEFHNRLVSTHHLHFANVLMARITDGPQRDGAYASIASILARHDHKYAGPPAAPAKSDKPVSG